MRERVLWSKKHPLFYFLSVWHKRARRHVQWRSASSFANTRCERLAFCVKRHQSVLVRRLGTSDPELQIKKITNLRIAAESFNRVLIRPGEIFSFWRLVGFPTRRKGYVEGMLLARGRVMTGIGGGLCQMSNLLHWLVMHTPLTVVERYHHGFDPFPDDGRVLPFGSGATVFYNYIDLQFRNDTDNTFQVLVWLTEKHLKGEIRCDQPLVHSFKVFEREHAFVRKGDLFYRQNQIWRRVLDRRTGDTVQEELIAANFAEVRYVPDQWIEEEKGTV